MPNADKSTLVAIILISRSARRSLGEQIMDKSGFFRRSGSLAMTRRLTRAAIVMALYGFMTPMTVNANPFLAKPGEAPTTVQVATCAVSGGFIHLYTAMDNSLFEKYGSRSITNSSAAAP
jgi:hypothetical protein